MDPVLEALEGALKTTRMKQDSEKQQISNATRRLADLERDAQALVAAIAHHTEK